MKIIDIFKSMGRWFDYENWNFANFGRGGGLWSLLYLLCHCLLPLLWIPRFISIFLLLFPHFSTFIFVSIQLLRMWRNKKLTLQWSASAVSEQEMWRVAVKRCQNIPWELGLIFFSTSHTLILRTVSTNILLMAHIISVDVIFPAISVPRLLIKCVARYLTYSNKELQASVLLCFIRSLTLMTVLKLVEIKLQVLSNVDINLNTWWKCKWVQKHPTVSSTFQKLAIQPALRGIKVNALALTFALKNWEYCGTQ
jgi:hypothetical protein